MSTWSEVKRELRWLTYSFTLHLAVATGLLFGVWNLYSAIALRDNRKSLFEDSLQQHAQLGETLEQALSRPLVVSVDAAGMETIDNPLRYDYEKMVEAMSVLTGPGLIANTLTLACMLLLPFAGFTIGMIIASHDLRSGGIVLRWPQLTPSRFLTAKLATSTGAMFVVVLIATLTSGVAGSFAGGGEDGYPLPQAPSALHLLALAGFATLIGTVFAALGLLIGSTGTQRAFALILFFAVYYLAPLLGPWDPRQWITSSGQPVMHYVGELRIPQSDDALTPSLLLLALTVVALAGFGAVWRWRAKMPARTFA
ncbi:MAG: hypothetical protein Q4D79_09100 [Propionibacteriaceae bacterium]|nr:hypothetical protein [Propionibacteriaceae bacterium]